MNDPTMAFVNTDQVQIEEPTPEPEPAEEPAAAPSEKVEEDDTVVPPLPPTPPPGAPPPPPMLTMKRTGSVPQVNPETTKYASQLIEEAMASLQRNELHAARERLTEANRIDPGNIPAIALLSKVDRALR